MIFLSAGEYIVPILDVVSSPDGKRIRSAHYLGTGFFISNKYLVTCRHVIEKAKNIPCAVYKAGHPTATFDGLKDIKFHPYADIAVAKVGDIAEKFYKPLVINFSLDIITGQDIANYSYIADSHENYQVALTPRLFRGYITRISVDRKDSRLSYLEVNFAALSGMSGSPILDIDANVIGIIYRNYRSQVLDDYIEEYEISDGETKLKETHTSYKVVDFGQAINLVKYKDFLMPFLAP